MKTAFKKPFKYDKDMFMVIDAEGNNVCQMRGWSDLGKKGYQLEEIAAIQDEFGNNIVKLLNQQSNG